MLNVISFLICRATEYIVNYLWNCEQNLVFVFFILAKLNFSSYSVWDMGNFKNTSGCLNAMDCIDKTKTPWVPGYAQQRYVSLFSSSSNSWGGGVVTLDKAKEAGKFYRQVRCTPLSELAIRQPSQSLKVILLQMETGILWPLQKSPKYIIDWVIWQGYCGAWFSHMESHPIRQNWALSPYGRKQKD